MYLERQIIGADAVVELDENLERRRAARELRDEERVDEVEQAKGTGRRILETSVTQ
jgi:hypothetical protein